MKKQKVPAGHEITPQPVKINWAKVAGTALSIFVIMMVMVYVNVLSRARKAYMKARKSYEYYRNPEVKKKDLQERFSKEKAALEKRLNMGGLQNAISRIIGAKGKISQEEFERQMEVLEGEQEMLLGENDLKYALVWHQTVVEMFCPPVSRYVRDSLPRIKEYADALFKQGLYVLAREGYETIERFDKKHPSYRKKAGKDWEAMVEESKGMIPVCWERIDKEK